MPVLHVYLQVQDGTPLQQYIYWSDLAFTTIFGLEVLVKSFAFTFRLYIKEVTNQVRVQYFLELKEWFRCKDDGEEQYREGACCCNWVMHTL
jgi:hypothetical protein